MKFLQKESGFAHMMVAVVAAVLVVGGVGVYTVSRINAKTTSCYPHTFSTNSARNIPCVRTIQMMVNWSTHRGFAAHGGYDGIYGPYTKSVVATFQKSQHISADGIVGPDTWGKLCAYGGGNTTYAYLRSQASCPAVYRGQ